MLATREFFKCSPMCDSPLATNTCRKPQKPPPSSCTTTSSHPTPQDPGALQSSGEKVAGPAPPPLRGRQPKEALQLWGAHLTSFERGEILGYPDVYFCGEESARVESNGECPVAVGAHVAYRFEVVRVLGQGSFGRVFETIDHANTEKLALKIVRSDPKFQQQARMECKILKILNSADPRSHIVRMHNHFHFRGHLCITLDLLGPNLYEYIKSRNFVPLLPADLKLVARQLLSVLAVLQKRGVIHCDLKPENIALVDRSVNPDIQRGVKVLDFGGSCFDGHSVYSYVQSRFYRSPEVVLGLPYSTPADIWSFGCVMAEMATGRPLFPADSEGVLLFQISRTLRLPPREMVKTGQKSWRYFNDQLNPYIPFTEHVPLSRRLCGDPLFSDFISHCIRWQPSSRSTATQLMKHPWLRADRDHGNWPFSFWK